MNTQPLPWNPHLLALLAGTPSDSSIPFDISLPGHRELLLLDPRVFEMELLEPLHTLLRASVHEASLPSGWERWEAAFTRTSHSFLTSSHRAGAGESPPEWRSSPPLLSMPPEGPTSRTHICSSLGLAYSGPLLLSLLSRRSVHPLNVAFSGLLPCPFFSFLYTTSSLSRLQI